MPITIGGICTLKVVQKVILHVGMVKTGSTSIQASLQNYDDEAIFYAQLGKANHSALISLIAKDYKPNDPLFALRGLKGISKNEYEKQKKNAIESLNIQLDRDDRDTIIISAESIWNFTPKEFNNLVALLRKRCKEIKVICYLRDPVSWSKSMLQQTIKTGNKNIFASSSFSLFGRRFHLSVVSKQIMRKESFVHPILRVE